MRLREAIALGVLAFGGVPSGALAQETPAAAPEMKLGLYQYREDGMMTSTVTVNSDDGRTLKGVLWVSPCGAMGTAQRAPSLAYVAWKAEGLLQGASPDGVTMQVTWQRLQSEGKAVAEPEQTTQVVLGDGDHHQIEQVVVPALGDCPARTITFEARYERPPAFIVAARARGVVGAIGIVSRGSGGGGGSAGGSGSVTSGAGRGVGVGGGGGTATAGGDGRSSGILQAPARTVQIWLVHSAPNRSEETLSTTTFAGPSPGDFAFPPLAISTPSGILSVRVTGTVELGMDASGQRRFVFGATRKVTYTPTNRPPRDTNTPVDSGGVAKTIGPVPGPDEVISYEMPPLSVPGAPSVSDAFSIRVRLTPR